MQEQIKALAERFGLKTDQVEAGLGAVLQFIQSKVPAQQWEQLSGLLPQAQGLVGKAAALPAAAKASAGGLMGQAGGLLDKIGGGTADGLATLTGKLQQAGIKPEAVPQFASAVVGQIKSKASPDQFKALMAQVPGLDKIGASAGGLMGGASDLLGKFKGKF